MKDYSKLLTDFYLRYNPDKVSEVSNLLTKYKGQEEALLKKLYEKYKIFQENSAEEKYEDVNPAENKIIDEQPAETKDVTGTPGDVMPEKEFYQETKPEEEMHTEVMPEKDIPQEIMPHEEMPVEVMPEKDLPREIMPQEEMQAEVLPEEEQAHEKIPGEVIPAELMTEEVQPQTAIPAPVKPDEIQNETGQLDETPKDLRELLTARRFPETRSVMYKTPPVKSKKRKFLLLVILLVVIVSGMLSLFYFLNRPDGGEYYTADGNSNEIQATNTYSDAFTENNPVKDEMPDSTSKTFNENKDIVASETLSQNQAEYVPAENRTKDSPVIQETAIPAADDLKDLTIYRIQILTSKIQRTENQIVIEGKTYNIYEYLYNNIFCYSIGEFTSGLPATEFKNKCRKNGYPDAFVVTIKNNERIR